MSKQVREFLEEVLEASEGKQDPGFPQWAQWVDSVDPDGVDGFAFVGDFINPGTVEVEVGERRLILATACSGNRKYRAKDYRILVLEADGMLHRTEIGTREIVIESRGGSTGSWALRIRDQVVALLDELRAQPVPIVTLEEVLTYLKVLPLITAAGITVTDIVFLGEEVEVKHQGKSDWFHATEAAQFIAVKIAEAIND